MNWAIVVGRAVEAIPVVVRLVNGLKVPGQTKKEKAIAAIPDVMGVTEALVGQDVFNDPAILALRDAAIDAEAAALKARDAYRAGLLAKQPTS